MTVTAIVLAGGRASRFGDDKLAAEIGGRSVLDRAIDAVRAVGDEVVVVGRRGTPGVRAVDDERPFEGPLAALATGLRAAASDTVLVVGGDMPALEPAVLGLLLRRLGDDGPSGDRAALGAVLEAGGAPRPLPCAVRRTPAVAAVEASLARGERSLRSLLGALVVVVVPEAEWRALDPAAGSVADVDIAEDLARLRAGLEGRGARPSSRG